MSVDHPMNAAAVTPGASDLPQFTSGAARDGCWIWTSVNADITLVPAAMPSGTTPIAFSVLAGNKTPVLARRVTAVSAGTAVAVW